MLYRLGIDLGGTKVNIGLLDKEKRIVSKRAVQLPESLSYTNVLEFIKEALDMFLDESGVSYTDICSCGIGVPGTVSSDGKTAVKVPNLHWENVGLAQDFEQLINIPVTLIQDSRAAAWGEYLAGAGRGKRVVVCITLGTGIGTGIVIDGKIFHGTLGGAGEMGHIPVVEGGRPCGCGKKGCLENYAAGKGIAITANEKMPEMSGTLSTRDVFRLAQEGNKTALHIIQDAVYTLGAAIVSLVNLLSPDILLFSGGISRQKTLFVEPLIQYIQNHCYSASPDSSLLIDYAALGEDAPMVGAALAPQNSKGKKSMLASASLMCADLLNLESDLKKLESANVDYIHFDIMDGHFVPNIMLPLDIIRLVRSKTTLPFDIHLMVQNPELFLPKLQLKEGDLVSIHWESTPHVQRAISMVKEQGAKAILALNPSTPIECCRDLLEDVDMILIMTVNPGYAGQKLIVQTIDKISRLRTYLDRHGYHDIRIQVDGNCSYENIAKMYVAGADTFVVGSSSVFDPELGIIKGMERFRKIIQH